MDKVRLITNSNTSHYGGSCTKSVLSTVLLFLWGICAVSGANPDISFYQRAVSNERAGEYEDSRDAQIAVAGPVVHIAYYSEVKSDNWTGVGTNRLWYRRSLDGGETFEPAVLVSEGPTVGPEGTAVLAVPYGTQRYMAVDGRNVHIVSLRSTTGGGWYYMVDYFRSTDGGVTFESRPRLVVGESPYWMGNPMITAAGGKVTIAFGYGQNWTGLTWMRTLCSTDDGATFPVGASLDQGTWGASLVGMTRSGDNIALAWQNDYWSTRSAYVAASTNGGVSYAVSRVNDVDGSGAGNVAFADDAGGISGGGSIRPKMAWSGQNLYVVWAGVYTNDTGYLRAFMARSTNGGGSFLPQECLSTDLPVAAGRVSGGHVTLSAKENQVYVLFNTVNGRVFLKRSGDRGETFQPIQEMGDADSPSVGGGWWNLIEADPNVADGSKVHVFTSDYYRASSDGGATFSPAVHLSTWFTPYSQVNRAQMAIDRGGKPHFVWDGRYSTATNGSDYADWDVFYRRYDVQAGALSTENQALKLERGSTANTRDPAGLRRDNLQIPSTPAMAFSNAMTVELWVRPGTNCAVDSKIVMRESPTAWQGVFRLQTHSWNGRRPSAKILTTNGVVELWGGTVLKDMEWHHLALTYDASTNVQNARLYVDGHLDVAVNASGLMDARGGITWVGGPDEVNSIFQGTVDELRFWNRALGEAEIRVQTSSRLRGSEPGLVGYYPLDGSTKELTGNMPDGVLMYREQFEPFSPSPVPVITSAALTSASAGYPFLHEVVADWASGFGVDQVPPGLAFDGALGRFTGTPTTPGVYNLAVVATNVHGSVRQALRIVVNDAVGTLFREDFNGSASASWQVIRDSPSEYSYYPGGLGMRAVWGDLWAGGNSAGNMFLIPTPTGGDFTLTLGVSRFSPGPNNYVQLSLMAYDDDNNYIRQAYGYVNGRTMREIFEVGGGPGGADVATDFGDGPFLLRLVRSGGIYQTYFSTNGVDFEPVFAPMSHGNGAPAKVGFWFGSDSTQTNTARIDFFEVKADAMPFFTGAGLAGGVLREPFQWRVTGPVDSTFRGRGLPPGLGIDPATGQISGTPVEEGVFDATISASNHIGSASQRLRIVIRGKDGVVFRDDFSGSLSAGWNPLPADTSYYHATNNSQLWLRANNGETWQWYNRELNLFSMNAPGTNDWMATLAVSRYEPDSVAYNQLNLVAWYDYDNSVRSGYGYGRGGSIVSENRQSIESYGLGIDFGSAPFLLRLVKSGQSYTGYYSTNGADFWPVGTNPVSLGLAPTMIGFWMGVDWSLANTAVLDYFEVVAFLAPEVRGATNAAAEYLQPFSYKVGATNKATSFHATGLPAGLTIDTASGVISGAPEVAGDFAVELTVANAYGTGAGVLNLHVGPGLPLITGLLEVQARVRVPFDYTIQSENRPDRFGATGLPVGLVVEGSSGRITGVPLESGTFSIVLGVTNAAGSAAATLLLVVDPPQPLNQTTVLQPGPGMSDGTDDGSIGAGKDRSFVGDPAGLSPTLYLYDSPCNIGRSAAYFQFSLAGLPTAGVTTVSVEVYGKAFFNGSGWAWDAKDYQISARRVSTSWTENSSPTTVAPLVLASKTVRMVGGSTPGFVEFEGWMSFDITSLYLGWVSGSVPNYGVEIGIDTTYCANGDEFTLVSSESGDATRRPRLVVGSGPASPVVALLQSDAQLRLAWSSVSNVIYQIESSVDLQHWSAEGPPVWGQGGATRVLLPRNGSARFYRLHQY